MPHYGDGRATSENIGSATRNSLERADEFGCESIVVPILGTGAAGFDFESGARLICEWMWQSQSGTLDGCRAIAYTGSEYETVNNVAERLGDGRRPRITGAVDRRADRSSGRFRRR